MQIFKLRRELYRDAIGVICPSRYLEPFLLVNIECLFAGTPHIVPNWGAQMEFCINKVTGYKCQDMDHYVNAIKNIDKIDPKICREFAMNFSLDKISLLYHDYFNMLLNHLNNGVEADYGGETSLNTFEIEMPYPTDIINERISEIRYPGISDKNLVGDKLAENYPA